jgi:hypothetical protein
MELGEIIEPALVGDLSRLKNVDQWVENDSHRKVGISRRGLIRLVTTGDEPEAEVGERRDPGAVGELGGIPRGLQQYLAVEQGQLRKEGQRGRDLLDLAGRFSVLFDDTDNACVVRYSGDLERLAVRVVDVHREILDEHRVTVRNRIKIGSRERRVVVKLRLVAPGDQPFAIVR